MSEKLTFTAISDVHVTEFHAGEETFAHAMQVMSEKFPAELYVFPGDIVYQLDSWSDSVCRRIHEGCYDLVNAQLDKYIPADTPRILVMGNHEYPQNNTDPTLTMEAYQLWQRKFGQKPMDHQVVKGYHFIKSPLYSWSMEPSPETEKWVMAEIDAALAADPAKPVFYLSHTCCRSTVSCSGGEKSFSDEFRTFLTARPRVIHISGHLHVHILDERCIYQEGFTSVSLPCNAVGYSCADGAIPGDSRITGMSQCLQFEVEGSRVVIHRIDCTAGKEYGEPWVVDTAEAEKGIQPYDRIRMLHAPRPEFAPDAKLWADVSASADSAEAADAASAESRSVKLTVEQKFAGDVFATYYMVTLTASSGARIERRFHSDFWRLVRDAPMADTLTMPLGDLKPDLYEAKVVPMNGVFGEGEGALRCIFIV